MINDYWNYWNYSYCSNAWFISEIVEMALTENAIIPIHTAPIISQVCRRISSKYLKLYRYVAQHKVSTMWWLNVDFPTMMEVPLPDGKRWNKHKTSTTMSFQENQKIRGNTRNLTLWQLTRGHWRTMPSFLHKYGAFYKWKKIRWS